MSDASAPTRDDDADPDGDPDGDAPEDRLNGYDDLLATLDVLEQEALRKVESGRVYDPENERFRIKWIRITKDVVAEKRKVMKERDLEELADRIDRLEDAREPELGDIVK